MNVAVGLMISAALLLIIAGVVPDRSFRSFTPYEKFIACYVIFLVGWPLMWTYLIGPLLWSSASDFSPAFWFLPALAMGLGYFTRTVLLAQSGVDLAALLQFSLLGIAVVILVGGGLNLDNLVHIGSAAILLLPTLVKPSRIRMDAIGWGCRMSAVVVVASVWLSVLINSSVTLEPCRADKCSVAGQVITSPFSQNGNILGLSLVLLMPFAVYRQSFYRIASMILGIGLAADLAGSRTAEAGIALALVLITAVWAWPMLRRSILIIGVGGALLISRIPAVMPFNDEQFTFRALLWNEGRWLIGQNRILGSGTFAWSEFAESSIQHDTNYSPHNGWLDVTVSIGFSGLIIMVAAIVLKVLLTRRDEADVLLLYFAVLLTLSTLESVYVPYTVGIVPFACVLPFLIGTNRQFSNDVSKDPAVHADDSSPIPARWRDAWTP